MRLCEVPGCGNELVQRPREPNVRFAERRYCCKECGYIGRKLTNANWASAKAPASWDDVQFPSYTIKPSITKLDRPATHVSYHSSATWAAV